MTAEGIVIPTLTPPAEVPAAPAKRFLANLGANRTVLIGLGVGGFCLGILVGIRLEEAMRSRTEPEVRHVVAPPRPCTTCEEKRAAEMAKADPTPEEAEARAQAANVAQARSNGHAVFSPLLPAPDEPEEAAPADSSVPAET